MEGGVKGQAAPPAGHRGENAQRQFRGSSSKWWTAAGDGILFQRDDVQRIKHPGAEPAQGTM